MRVATIFGTTLALTAGIGGHAVSQDSAARWHSLLCSTPDLIDATTTFNSVHEWGATLFYHQRTSAGRQENPPKGNNSAVGGDIRFSKLSHL